MHVYKFTNLNPFLNMCVSHAPRIQLFMLLIVAGVWGGLFVDVVILGDGVGLGYLIRDLQWANKSCFYIVESS